MRFTNLIRFVSVTALFAFLISFSPDAAESHPLHPEVVKKLREEGKLDDYVRDMKMAESRGLMISGPEYHYRRTLSLGDGQDTLRLVVLLVDFDDNAWNAGLADGSPEYFDSLLFSQEYLPYGSMRDYYLDNSYGDMVFIGDVYGWLRMPLPYSYYVAGQRGFGPYDEGNAQKLVEDAINIADAIVDYSPYDNDGDGWVEGLVIVHAGEGYETSGNVNQIHSHRWNITAPITTDGVRLFGYTCQPEENSYTASRLIGIGVFCHEFGHTLGLPDLYDTDYSSEGIGNWSVMAGGSHNGNGESPARFDAWCKTQLGFIEPIQVTGNELNHEFPQVADAPHILQMWTGGAPGGQYFLVSNRQKTGFDATLPGEGLLILHVNDDAPSNNDDESNYMVALEQADGLFELENNRDRGDGGDPFPGYSNNREFSDRTTPNSKGRAGSVTQVAVWDISDSDSVMTANIDVFFSRPWFSLADWSFDDSAGNGNGVLDLGETIDFYFLLQNAWADANDVTATLTVSDARLQVDIGEIDMGIVAGFGSVSDNESSPLRFTIPSDMDTVQVKFTLTIEHSGVGESTTFEVKENVGGAKVLIVDDDGDDDYLYLDRIDWYTDALDSLGYTYKIWGKDSLGTPGSSENRFPILIWFTGDTRETSLTQSDVNFMKDYLDVGGGAFFTGQDFVERISDFDPDFVTDYMKCSWSKNIQYQYMARSNPESEIGAGDSVIITGYDDGAGNLLSADVFDPVDSSEVTFTYGSGDVAGLEITGDTYRAVLFGFGFEAINSTYEYMNYITREDVMGRVMDFLNSREGIGNRPPQEFSLISPVDGDTVETDSVVLTWHTSIDLDYLDEVSYTLYYSASDTSSWSSVGSIADTQFTLTGLVEQEYYYWKVHATDLLGLSTACTSTRMFHSTGDITPPSFTINSLPNSVFSFELDIYAFPSEELSSTPSIMITTPSGSSTQNMTALANRETEIYLYDLSVDQSGAYTITICGSDGSANSGCTDESFSAAPLFRNEPTTLENRKGSLRISVPPGAVDREALLIIYDEGEFGVNPDELDFEPGFAPVASFKMKSSARKLESNARMAFQLDELGITAGETESVAVYRLIDGDLELVKGQVATGGFSFEIEISDLDGIFIIGKSETGGGIAGAVVPRDYQLLQNWPNPFNAGTTIAFDIPEPSSVKLVIYNLLGQQVVTLIDESLPSGRHIRDWFGKSSDGEDVATGIYFYRLQTDSFSETKRMLLLK